MSKEYQESIRLRALREAPQNLARVNDLEDAHANTLYSLRKAIEYSKGVYENTTDPKIERDFVRLRSDLMKMEKIVSRYRSGQMK